MDGFHGGLYQGAESGARNCLDPWKRVFENTMGWGCTARNARDLTIFCIEVRERLCTLATKKAQNDHYEGFYFVNCAVSENDLPEIDALYHDAAQVFDFLAGVLAEGLKVSFALNTKNDLTICSLTDKREKSPSNGACLTGGAEGWYDALRVVAYKYTALLQGDLGSGAVGGRSSSRIM